MEPLSPYYYIVEGEVPLEDFDDYEYFNEKECDFTHDNMEES